MNLKQETLLKYWGYEHFRPPQEAIIDAVLNQENILAIMPTGAGKSLCFQLPSVLMEGVCLVVSPLIALMKDQVERLRNRGLKAEALAGNLSQKEVNRILNNGIYGGYKFLYLSPERLQNPLVAKYLQQIPICLIAIDEAHCISHWGKDFRPAYLECKKLREWFPKTPVIALTASATLQVEKNILENLQMPQAKVFKSTLSRRNLAYMVYPTPDKTNLLQKILEKNKGSSIIYVGTRRQTIQLADFLNFAGFSATYFHGGLLPEQKNINMNLWLYGDVQIMVATNAFGMGIDKPDVRTVIHWELPNSIEDYYQEAGRAGRDGKKSFAVLLFNSQDEKKFRNLLENRIISIENIKNIYSKLGSYLHVAYGEGENTSHLLNIAKFCQYFKLNPSDVYETLEVLDRNSILSVSKISYQKASVQILVNNSGIMNYVKDSKPREKILLHYLIRKFGEIYSQTVSFKLENVAYHLKMSSEELQKLFENLDKNQIISYRYQYTDLEITFLVPRENDLTINTIRKEIEQFNQLKIKQHNDVLQYINTENECLEKHLLNYFGEETQQNCGICSFCIAQKRGKKYEKHHFKEQILNILQKESLTSHEICTKLNALDSEILPTLTQLLEEEKISLTPYNQYFII